MGLTIGATSALINHVMGRPAKRLSRLIASAALVSYMQPQIREYTTNQAYKIVSESPLNIQNFADTPIRYAVESNYVQYPLMASINQPLVVGTYIGAAGVEYGIRGMYKLGQYIMKRPQVNSSSTVPTHKNSELQPSSQLLSEVSNQTLGAGRPVRLDKSGQDQIGVKLQPGMASVLGIMQDRANFKARIEWLNSKLAERNVQDALGDEATALKFQHVLTNLAQASVENDLRFAAVTAKNTSTNRILQMRPEQMLIASASLGFDPPKKAMTSNKMKLSTKWGKPQGSSDPSTTLTLQSEADEIGKLPTQMKNDFLKAFPSVANIVFSQPIVAVQNGITAGKIRSAAQINAFNMLTPEIQDIQARLLDGELNKNPMLRRAVEWRGVPQPSPQTSNIGLYGQSQLLSHHLTSRGSKLANMSSDAGPRLQTSHNKNLLYGHIHHKNKPVSKLAPRGMTQGTAHLDQVLSKAGYYHPTQSTPWMQTPTSFADVLQHNASRSQTLNTLGNRVSFVTDDSTEINRVNKFTVNYILTLLENVVDGAQNTIGTIVRRRQPMSIGEARGEFQSGQYDARIGQNIRNNPVYEYLYKTCLAVSDRLSNYTNSRYAMQEALMNWTDLEYLRGGKVSRKGFGGVSTMHLTNQVKEELLTNTRELKKTVLHLKNAGTMVDKFNQQMFTLRVQVETMEAALAIVDEDRLINKHNGDAGKIVADIVHTLSRGKPNAYNKLFVTTPPTGDQQSVMAQKFDAGEELMSRVSTLQKRQNAAGSALDRSLNMGEPRVNDTMMFGLSDSEEEELDDNAAEGRRMAQDIVQKGESYFVPDMEPLVYAKGLQQLAVEGNIDGSHSNINNAVIANRGAGGAQMAPLKVEANLAAISPAAEAMAKYNIARINEMTSLVSTSLMGYDRALSLGENIRKVGLAQQDDDLTQKTYLPFSVDILQRHVARNQDSAVAFHGLSPTQKNAILHAINNKYMKNLQEQLPENPKRGFDMGGLMSRVTNELHTISGHQEEIAARIQAAYSARRKMNSAETQVYQFRMQLSQEQKSMDPVQFNQQVVVATQALGGNSPESVFVKDTLVKMVDKDPDVVKMVEQAFDIASGSLNQDNIDELEETLLRGAGSLESMSAEEQRVGEMKNVSAAIKKADDQMLQADMSEDKGVLRGVQVMNSVIQDKIEEGKQPGLENEVTKSNNVQKMADELTQLGVGAQQMQQQMGQQQMMEQKAEEESYLQQLKNKLASIGSSLYRPSIDQPPQQKLQYEQMQRPRTPEKQKHTAFAEDEKMLEGGNDDDEFFDATDANDQTADAMEEEKIAPPKQQQIPMEENEEGQMWHGKDVRQVWNTLPKWVRNAYDLLDPKEFEFLDFSSQTVGSTNPKYIVPAEGDAFIHKGQDLMIKIQKAKNIGMPNEVKQQMAALYHLKLEEVPKVEPAEPPQKPKPKTKAKRESNKERARKTSPAKTRSRTIKRQE